MDTQKRKWYQKAWDLLLSKHRIKETEGEKEEEDVFPKHESRELEELERLVTIEPRPIPPEGFESDPYGELYPIYPNQHGSFWYHQADADTILYAPDYIAVETETTGLDVDNDKIIEIGAVRVHNGRIVDRFQTVVNPECIIPLEIYTLTGISPDEIKQAPGIEAAIEEFALFLDETLPVVGHNVIFDLDVLQLAYWKGVRSADIKFIDTLSLARDAWPDLPHYSLRALIDYFDLPPHKQTHRALNDATAVAHLYALARKTIKQNIDKSQQLAQRYAKPAKVVRLIESKAFYLDRYGNICESVKQPETAILYYERAVEIDPALFHAGERLAILYRKAGRYEDEIELCKRVAQAAGEINDQFHFEYFNHRIEYTSKRMKKK